MGNDAETQETVGVNLSQSDRDELRELYPHALNDSERIRFAIHDAKRFDTMLNQIG